MEAGGRGSVSPQEGGLSPPQGPMTSFGEHLVPPPLTFWKSLKTRLWGWGSNGGAFTLGVADRLTISPPARPLIGVQDSELHSVVFVSFGFCVAFKIVGRPELTCDKRVVNTFCKSITLQNI